jgi:hypothetical protein
VRDFQDYKREAAESDVAISLEPLRRPPSHLSNEALFHIPLLSCVVLALSCLARKPRSSEIGQMVGECMERTFVSFKGSSQRLGWSANLRVRTVSALSFLEQAGLVTAESQGMIAATDKGREVIKRAFVADDDLSYTLLQVERAYRDICGERRSQMDLL